MAMASSGSSIHAGNKNMLAVPGGGKNSNSLAALPHGNSANSNTVSARSYSGDEHEEDREEVGEMLEKIRA